MRWLVILFAAAPLAYAVDPSEVEKPARSTTVETADPAQDPDYVSEEEQQAFKALGFRLKRQDGEMRWCRREGVRSTGSNFKQLVCYTPDQVRMVQQAEAAKKTKRSRAE